MIKVGKENEMKRKYDNPKVKPGDWVYFLEDYSYETKYSYKVVKVKIGSITSITVEVNKNKKDFFIGGWQDKRIGDGRYWNVERWTKCCLMEIE